MCPRGIPAMRRAIFSIVTVVGIVIAVGPGMSSDPSGGVWLVIGCALCIGGAVGGFFSLWRRAGSPFPQGPERGCHSDDDM